VTTGQRDRVGQQPHRMRVVASLRRQTNAQRVNKIAPLEPPLRTGLDVGANPAHRVLGHRARSDRQRRERLSGARAKLDVRLADAGRDRHHLFVERRRGPPILCLAREVGHVKQRRQPIRFIGRLRETFERIVVTFAGERIEGLTPDAICRRGIGRTFQNVRPFPGLSVEDNVVIGALLRRPDMPSARAHARAVLEALDLADKRAAAASSLTLPDRKRLEVARVLATDPKLLLLDEVMAGLRPTETDRMVAILRQLNRDTGITILLIEHVMRAVMALASRVLVLHHGAAIAQGTPRVVVRDPAVIASYLGAEAVG